MQQSFKYLNFPPSERPVLVASYGVTGSKVNKYKKLVSDHRAYIFKQYNKPAKNVGITCRLLDELSVAYRNGKVFGVTDHKRLNQDQISTCLELAATAAALSGRLMSIEKVKFGRDLGRV